MKKSIQTFTLISLLATASTHLFAADFFSDLDIQQVQKIFQQADENNTGTFVNHTGAQAIPVVQILPQIVNAQMSIEPGASCIKLYNCNQGICLLAFANAKLAVNEDILNRLTTKSTNPSQCLTDKSGQQLAKITTPTAKPTPPKATVSERKFSWVKVVNVKSNDSLNIRQKANYKTKKMGSIAYNASCIKRFSCNGKWCNIQAGSVTGWVHRNYLQKISKTAANSCS